MAMFKAFQVSTFVQMKQQLLMNKTISKWMRLLDYIPFFSFQYFEHPLWCKFVWGSLNVSVSKRWKCEGDMPFTHAIDFSGDKRHCQTRNLVRTCVLTQDEVEVYWPVMFVASKCHFQFLYTSSPWTVGVRIGFSFILEAKIHLHLYMVYIYTYIYIYMYYLLLKYEL